MERLRQVLHYDQDTDEFTWLTRAHRVSGAKPGAKAGNSKWKTIKLDGVKYGTRKLAWFYVYGEWPTRHVLGPKGESTRLRYGRYLFSDPAQRKLYNREKNYRKKYGISLAEYERLHADQNGLCAICGAGAPPTWEGPGPFLVVDHRHGSQEIRGLLCSPCNTALGSFQESTTILESAIQYLARAALAKSSVVPFEARDVA